MAAASKFPETALGKQINIIDSWAEVPSRKLEFLYRFVVYNYFLGVRHLRRDDPIMGGVATEFRQRFLQEMANRAYRLRLDDEIVWQNTIGALTPKPHISEHELLMVLAHVDRLINPTSGLRAIPVNGPVVQSPNKKLRVLRGAAAPGPIVGEYLIWKEIRPVWQAASFLAQHYGVLLNVRMTIRHRALEILDHAVGAHLASDLVHELGMRLRDWSAPKAREFHWMLRHESDCDGYLVTRVMMSICSDHLPDAVHWVRNRFLRRRGGSEEASVLLIACQEGGTLEQRVRFHWACMRALSRSLDGAELGRSSNGGRMPLVELLRIPKRWRSPTGDIRCRKKRLASESLGREAQQLAAGDRMAFLSALDDGAWRHLDSGWELLEHRDREAEIKRRLEDAGRIRGLFDGDDALTIARCTEELKLLRAGYSDARKRLRSWNGWWNASSGRGLH